MDWVLFSQLMAAFTIALVGHWVGHYFAARRDVANERRSSRISYLLEAYRQLEFSCHRKMSGKIQENFERAMADIQLLGSRKQIKLVLKVIKQMDKDQHSSPGELLANLRDSLRLELKLEKVDDKIMHLRFKE